LLDGEIAATRIGFFNHWRKKVQPLGGLLAGWDFDFILGDNATANISSGLRRVME
jgi:hypothetical protein